MSRAPHVIILLLTALLTLPAAAQEPTLLRGRVVTADGGRADSLRAFVRWRVAGDTALRERWGAVDAEGRFELVVPPVDSLQLIVDAANRERRAYHPALARIPRRRLGEEQGFVLVPRAWTIPSGRYAGQAVPVSPHRARTPVCPGCSMFWVRAQPQGQEAVPYQGWPLSRFPLRVGFDREHSVPVGTAPDSTAFWIAIDLMEEAFGQDLFRPVRYTQTLAQALDQDGPDDVVLVVIDPGIPVSGLTMVLARRGMVDYAAVTLQRRREMFTEYGPELVAHEMMHALGFGHTCAWRSVAADLNRCPQMRAGAPTPQDVAHAQVLYRVRDLQRTGGFRWGIDAATSGERVLVMGLPDTP